MANQLALVWDLIAVDHASGTFGRVGAAADSTAGSVKRLVEGFGALAVGGAIVASVKQAADFQKQMLLVQTQAGATAQEVRNMSPAILALAGQVAQAPEALANSLYHVESTGLRGKAALDAVRVAAEGAKVGNADLEQTTNALTATIASGMLPATETYSQAMGQLNTIVGSGDMKMQDLNDSLSTGLLVTVKQYGVTLNDVGAALADFGDNNLRGQDAATKLRMAVQALESPAKAGAAALAKIGLTSGQLAQDMATGGLNKALTDLHTHLVNSGIDANQWGQILTDAFTKKAGSGVLTLIGTFDRFQQKYQEVSKGADSFGNAWQATTKTASFQFSQLKDTVDALGIKLGTALLKPLGDFASWLSTTGIPAVERFATSVSHVVSAVVSSSAFKTTLDAVKTVGSTLVNVGKDIAGVVLPAVQGLAHWFGQLPGPMQLAIEGFAVLRIAAAKGIFDPLISGLGRLSGSLTSNANLMRTAFGEAKAGVQGVLGDLSGSLIGRSTANLAGLGAAAGQLGSGALATLKKAGSGVVDMLGGPWGLAIAGATGVIALMESAIQQATQKENAWTDAMKQGGQAAQTAAGQMEQADQVRQKLTTGLVGFGTTLIGLKGVIDASLPDSQKAKQAYDAWYNGLDRVGKAQEAVTQATSHYNDIAGQYGPASSQARSAAAELQQANFELKTTQDDVNTATQTHLSLLKQQSDMELASINSDLAAMQATGQLDSAIAQYNQDASDGKHTTAQLKQESANLAQQTLTTAQAVAQHAADQAKANGVTDTSIVYQNTLHDTLVNLAKQLTGPARDAVLQMADATAGATVKTADFKDATDKLGLMVAQAWPNGTKVVQDATSQQIDALKQLGYTVVTLPGSDPKKPQTIWVTADTSQAYQNLSDFLKQAQALGFVGALHGFQPIGAPGSTPGSVGIIGLPGIPGHAEGGPTPPGPKYQPAGIVHAGENVWSQADVAAWGGMANVEALRTLRGYADGGLVWPAAINPSLLSQWNGALKAATSFTGSGTGAGSPFIRILGQAIAASMGFGSQFNAIDYIFSHESGWNPLAQNPTSTAFGIPQFLNSTWAAYGGKTTDAAAQIRDGISYMRDRYGSPNAAAAFWQGHHWYDGGGWLMPGVTVAHNNTGRPERVRTAQQESTLQGRSAPLMQVEHMHVNDQVDLDLALRQAQFRERSGAFS